MAQISFELQDGETVESVLLNYEYGYMPAYPRR